MLLRPPRSTRTATLFPYPTLFRSLAGLAEGEYRLVFDQPQLVGGVLVAGVGERLHGAPDWFVGLAAEIAHQPAPGGWGYSVHFTPGWARREIGRAHV